MNKEMKKWCDDRYPKTNMSEMTFLEVIFSVVVAISFVMAMR